MRTRAFTFFSPVVLVVCGAVTVAAQQAPAPRPAAPATASTSSPTFELSGGYQVFHVPDRTFPFGLNVDVAHHRGALGLVGEIGFANAGEDDGEGEEGATAWNFGAGGRWTRFSSGRVWPFAQVLLGLEVMRGRAKQETGDTSFMLQPGVGINYVAGDGWGIVGQIDYRRTFFDEPDNVESSINNQFRVFIGARMILD
jgi:hypothetical protein